MATLTLTQLASRLDHGQRIGPYLMKVKAAGMKANDSAGLSKAVDTRTSQSSTAPFEGDPVGRMLNYGPGHTPLGESAVDAALEAAGPHGTVGWLNDALHKGRPYAFFVKGYTEDWRRGFERQHAAITARAQSAWHEAGEEAR
jgi:hypothetical protein